MNCKSNVTVFSWLLVSIAWAGLPLGQLPAGDATPKSIDATTWELYRQYILRVGKIESDSVRAAIDLVAARSDRAPEFQELLRQDFATSRQADNQGYDSRKLLSLITAVLRRDGGKRWQHEYEKRTGVPGQQVLPSAEYLYRE